MTKKVQFLINITYNPGLPIIGGQKHEEGAYTTIIKRRLLIENIKSPNDVAFDFFSKKFQSRRKRQTMTPI